VLYIEDNVSNLDLVEEVFEERPEITLLTAVQGKLGIALAREHKPDVVLLDLNLPDLSGEIVLERLRGDPATASIPVIVVTADATENQRALVTSRGATAYITKPIDIDELLGAVDDAMFAPAGQDK
jgi:CheY-like chemotaxis protein